MHWRSKTALVFSASGVALLGLMAVNKITGLDVEMVYWSIGSLQLLTGAP